MSFEYSYINDDPSGSAQDLMWQLVKKTNLTAKRLADAMNVAPSTVTRILHGTVCPSYDDMLSYVDRLGFEIYGKELRRSERFRGYKSPKELGDFVNAELKEGLTEERLRTILRFIPKAIMDWRLISPKDAHVLMLQPASIEDNRFQALTEGAVQYFAHTKLWEDAPSWTYKTQLKEMFVPRAALREIGSRRYEKLLKKSCPEFLNKNVLFTYDEMLVL